MRKMLYVFEPLNSPTTKQKEVPYMDKVIVVEGQSKTFDVLAKLLRTRREKVVELVGRKTHPLPLPAMLAAGNKCDLSGSYRHTLHQWVAEEKKLQEKMHESQLNLTRIELELADAPACDKTRENWSVEQSIDNFPPGNFLG